MENTGRGSKISQAMQEKITLIETLLASTSFFEKLTIQHEIDSVIDFLADQESL